jgi:TPR repeat protein
MKLILGVLILVAAGLAAPASSQEQDALQKGLAAYQAGRFEEAMALWRPLAESGNTEAQYDVGVLFALGQGVEADPEVAANWYRRAASLGHAKAQFNLGVALLEGKGVEADVTEAARWLEKSAKQGYGPAELALGLLLLEGRGVPKDPIAGAGYVGQAAAQGDTRAMGVLGVLYRDGTGVEKDQDAAARWVLDAARGGDAKAVYQYARLEALRQGTDAAANEVEIMHKAAEAGLAEAQYDYAAALCLGKEVSKDETACAGWLRKAAEQGHARSAYDLGVLCRDGGGVKKDPAEAARWFRVAAEAGFPQAQYAYAQALLAGAGVARDETAALHWALSAARSGLAKAQYLAATMYLDAKDYGQALVWLRRGAEARDGDSMYALGNLYANGWGVAEDRREARRWYCEAARLGQPWAVRMVGGDGTGRSCTGLSPPDPRQ